MKQTFLLSHRPTLSKRSIYFILIPDTHFSPARSCLPLISALTGFHNWGLVTRWAQLLITSNCYLPSTPLDQSNKRAEHNAAFILLQQKSAVDSSLTDQPNFEDKGFGGGGQNFGSFSAFVDPIGPLVSDKDLQSKLPDSDPLVKEI